MYQRYTLHIYTAYQMSQSEEKIIQQEKKERELGVIQCVLQSIPDCPPEASNICLQAPLCLFWRSTDEHRSR